MKDAIPHSTHLRVSTSTSIQFYKYTTTKETDNRTRLRVHFLSQSLLAHSFRSFSAVSSCSPNMRNSWHTFLLIATTLCAVPETASQDTDDELKLITTRRTADLSEFPSPPWFEQISTWLATQEDDGTWQDVNYVSGCDARK